MAPYRNILLLICVAAAGGAWQAAAGEAAAPAATAGHAPAGHAIAVAAAPKPQVVANLRQLMRGVLFPASNVVFAAQSDLDQYKPAGDPSQSPNPLTSTYGGWEAVQNAALALGEAANLVALPGRLCANGRPVPTGRADWPKFVQGLRTAAADAYKAAQTKSEDAMLDAADKVTQACSACHEVYRDKEEKGGDAKRCLP